MTASLPLGMTACWVNVGTFSAQFTSQNCYNGQNREENHYCVHYLKWCTIKVGYKLIFFKKSRSALICFTFRKIASLLIWGKLHFQVAIKSIRKDKIKDEQDLLHIRREIEIMSSLNHPHIIAVHEGKNCLFKCNLNLPTCFLGLSLFRKGGNWFLEIVAAFRAGNYFYLYSSKAA